MYVAVMRKPGTILEIPEPARSQIQALFDLMQGLVTDANVALISFNAVYNMQEEDIHPLKMHNYRSSLQYKFEREVQEQFDREYAGKEDKKPSEEHQKIEAWARVAAVMWEAGAIPAEFRQPALLMHAKSFIYSLATFRKALEEAYRLTGVDTTALRAVHDRFVQSFPDLIALRDSTAHVEDRVLSRARQKTIVPQPIDAGLFKSEESEFFLISCLVDISFQATGRDGHLKKIDVSEGSLAIVNASLHDSWSCFKWTGPLELSPMPL